MAMRIISGFLMPTERSGRATISFNPPRVTGDADGVEIDVVGANGAYARRPAKMFAVREFKVRDRDTFGGGSEDDWFRISDLEHTPNHVEVEWGVAGGGQIAEISFLILGDTD